MYVAYTVNGIEDIAEKEVGGKKIFPQRIKFSKQKKDYRSINKVIKILKIFTFNNLEDLLTQIDGIIFQLKGTFKVDCKREGSHNFRSIDIEINAGKIIIKKGFKVDLKKPSNIIFIDVFENNCMVGVLIKDRLCKRSYRLKINNKSINACLAYALLKISDVKKTESILDPFCKDGVIPIEAGLSKIKKVYSSDPIKNNIRNSLINSKLAKTRLKFENYDVSWLDTKFKRDSIDKIITNIFISRIDREPEKLIKEFFHQSHYVVKKTITLITNKPDMVKSNTDNNFILKSERKIQIGEMIYYILEFSKTT
ncbi:MAG: THUMP domain-containing protein [Nanoarchaeota archaeon]